MLQETVPEFLANMKNIREDSRYLHKITSPEAISEQKMEVGFDIDESFASEGKHLENKNLGRSIIPTTSSENNFDSDKSSSEPEKQLVNDLLATITRNLPMKGVTPPPTPLPSKKSLGFGKQSKLLTQKGILKKVQALVRRARLDDDQKRERGEFANSAEMPVDTMPKINNEYEELVQHAKELDNEYFESMKHRAEKTRLAGMVPVVTAACQDCCFPTEEVGESVGFRYLLNSIHNTAMFQKHGVKYEWGPLCWMHEAPKLEDNYRNIVPGLMIGSKSIAKNCYPYYT
uniref:Protein F10C2.5 n=1 Tax=Haemonchus contortus TaxID=6289 RepID=W6NCQ1_HAECO